MTYRRKLIEVALPLEAINVASAREKSIRHGHPSTLHLWWARRPLAACRAVLFSSLVDDPSEYMPDEESAHIERERLFRILEELVLWENSNNEVVLDKARLEIARSVAHNLGVDVPIGREAIREFLATKAPPVLDPFAGGGSIPLEAQRLGLRAYASDLNPVAVLINKAMIEIPPKFANMPPVHPPEESSTPKGKGKKGEGTMPIWQKEWKGAQGLAEDVRYYGKWMRDEAFKRIGHLYPLITITNEMLAERPDLREQGLKAGDQLTVIAWLWARTVKCPNPACGAQMPLIRTFWVSTKKGRETWVEPIVNKHKNLKFVIRRSIPIDKKYTEAGSAFVKDNGKKAKATFRCIICENSVVRGEYLDEEANNNRMGTMPVAIVADSLKGRVYFNLTDEISSEILTNNTENFDKQRISEKIPTEPARGTFASNAQGRIYGFNTFADYFTPRQQSTLALFSELIKNLTEKIVLDAREHGLSPGNTLQEDGKDGIAYAQSVIVYLAFALDKGVDYWSSLCSWHVSKELIRNTFGRQAIAMVWDFAECNPFSNSTGNWGACVDWVSKVLEHMAPAYSKGNVTQADAAKEFVSVDNPIISTDPPYYGNVSYSELSDFLYVWLRRSVGKIYSNLFSTTLTPKSAEIVATPFRFDGDRQKAEKYFLLNLGRSFELMSQNSNHNFPISVFYAYKQTEESDENIELENGETELGAISTGWEKMLQGLLDAKFQISGTWPMRTELSNRMVGSGSNALASSIVLICRIRSHDASSASRREFLSTLKKELAPALRQLQQGSIAPVDLAQAAIGPGMAVFSRHSAVLEADGKSMSVRTALGLINQALDEYLTEQEGEYDSDTRWALAWYEQFGHDEAAFGTAETLSRAKNTSVKGLVEAGILEARAGKVRLLRRDELDTDWDPAKDKRLTSWEVVQHLIHILDTSGEQTAAELLARLGSVAETARDLAYRLYTVCERKGWAQDALGYNMLVVAWPRLKEQASRAASQPELPL